MQKHTATGRRASEPNLQNIPISSRQGRCVRAGFDAQLLVIADYAEIEQRVLSHLTQTK